MASEPRIVMRLAGTLACVAATSLPLVAAAHHAFVTEFDPDIDAAIEGTVKSEAKRS